MTTPLQAVLRTDLSCFTQKVFNTVDPSADYMHNWHLDLIAEYLKACQDGEIKRLIINIPPRFLKSISVSVAFPAWLLGHNPSTKIMTSSYSQDLSLKHSIDCRFTLESKWYQELFPNTKLVEDQNTKKKFVTTERGHRIATSVGGSATGEGADYLIVDDPHSAKQAQSQLFRQTACDWFDQTFSTRLNDKKNGVIIVIMQRLHDEDLTGHLLKKGGWEHLCLPLIADKDEVLQKGSVRVERTIGHNLHPDRMGDEEILIAKAELGSYAFSGQYQQKPSPEGGGEFRKEWLKEYESINASTLNKYILVDPANSKQKKSDYTAMWVVGFGADKNCYAIDIVRDKLNIKERSDTLLSLHEKHKPLGVLYQKYGIEADVDYVKSEMGRRNYHFDITPVSTRMNKEDRIRRLIPKFFNGEIWLPKELFKTNHLNQVKEVIDEFIHQEYLAFPVGINDDLLDSLAMISDIPNIIYPGDAEVDYYKLYR
jgi:predicted phage terminase large subunit-like protein